jgi:hypothetical protein
MKNRSISDSYCPYENAYLLRKIIQKMEFAENRKNKRPQICPHVA